MSGTVVNMSPVWRVVPGSRARESAVVAVACAMEEVGCALPESYFC